MKKIRSIRFIDIFTYTDDHSLEYVIDLTKKPYFYPDINIMENLINIGKIIYRKSLSLGFTKIESAIFAEKAIKSNMKKFNVDYDISTIVMKIYDDDLLLRKENNKLMYFIQKNNSNEIIIQDHNPSVTCILKELSGIDAKYIELVFNLKSNLVTISYCSHLNKIVKIIDIDTTDTIIQHIKGNINNSFKFFVDIKEDKNSITISLFQKNIFSLTKITIQNIIKDNLELLEENEENEENISDDNIEDIEQPEAPKPKTNNFSKALYYYF
ncbi:hypothetical protein CPAV1605_429 [seawater metagenome]|uniref:Uncharacterized protein n=1 Tax=seawater metagenome TaxID=1561972 RepID=A0A5E8CJ61_9ZZZZ